MGWKDLPGGVHNANLKCHLKRWICFLYKAPDLHNLFGCVISRVSWKPGNRFMIQQRTCKRRYLLKRFKIYNYITVYWVTWIITFHSPINPGYLWLMKMMQDLQMQHSRWSLLPMMKLFGGRGNGSRPPTMSGILSMLAPYLSWIYTRSNIFFRFSFQYSFIIGMIHIKIILYNYHCNYILCIIFNFLR